MSANRFDYDKQTSTISEYLRIARDIPKNIEPIRTSLTERHIDTGLTPQWLAATTAYIHTHASYGTDREEKERQKEDKLHFNYLRIIAAIRDTIQDQLKVLEVLEKCGTLKAPFGAAAGKTIVEKINGYLKLHGQVEQKKELTAEVKDSQKDRRDKISGSVLPSSESSTFGASSGSSSPSSRVLGQQLPNNKEPSLLYQPKW